MSYLNTILTRSRPTGQRPTQQRDVSVAQKVATMMSGAPSDKVTDISDYLGMSNTVYACMSGRANLLKTLPLKVYKFSQETRTKLPYRKRRARARSVMTALRMMNPPGNIPVNTYAHIQSFKRAIANAGLEEVTDSQLGTLLQTVNPHWTYDRLIDLTEGSLSMWGKSVWFLDRGDNLDALPGEIWTAPGNRVKIIPSEDNYIERFEYTPEGATKPIPYSPKEVVWFNYADPRNIYGSLSPLETAGVYAGYEHDSMKANALLHKQGFIHGGFIFPKDEDEIWDETDAGAIETAIAKRVMGIDKAHRWSVLRKQVGIEAAGITPREAEFIEGLNLSARAIARAYNWPVFLLGIDDATFQNLKEAKSGAWTQAVIPEAMFIASEITEQLVPIFQHEADLVLYDYSEIPELQEDEAVRWGIASEKIEKGALLINEYRESQGQDPLPHGGVWWRQNSLTDGSEPAAPRFYSDFGLR